MPNKSTPDDRTASERLLEFIAGLSMLERGADEPARLAAAARAGLTTEQVARLFDKTEGAAQKALERARKAKS